MRGSRSACLTPHDSSTRGPRPIWPKEGNIARVPRHSLLLRLARDSCLPRLVRRKLRVSFFAGRYSARIFTCTEDHGRRRLPCCLRQLGGKRQRPSVVATGQDTGACLAGSGRREGYTLKENADSADKTHESSQRQDLSRAPQPNCALNIDRIFVSCHLQYCVFAALQPIANHIHRPADYPVDTPV